MKLSFSLLMLLFPILAQAKMKDEDQPETTPAAASASTPTVDPDYLAGKKAFTFKQFDLAVYHFERAYQATHSTAIYYNLCRSYEEQKRPDFATKCFSRYTELREPEIENGATRDDSDEYAQRYVSDRKYLLSIDNKQPEWYTKDLLKRELANKKAEEVASSPTSGPTSTAYVSPLAPRDPPPPTKVEEKGFIWQQEHTAYTIAGAALVLAGAGTYFGLESNSLVDDAKSRQNNPDYTVDQANAPLNEAETSRKLAYAFWASSAAALGVATYLYLTDDSDKPHQGPVASPNSIGWGGQF